MTDVTNTSNNSRGVKTRITQVFTEWSSIIGDGKTTDDREPRNNRRDIISFARRTIVISSVCVDGYCWDRNKYGKKKKQLRRDEMTGKVGSHSDEATKFLPRDVTTQHDNNNIIIVMTSFIHWTIQPRRNSHFWTSCRVVQHAETGRKVVALPHSRTRPAPRTFSRPLAVSVPLGPVASPSVISCDILFLPFDDFVACRPPFRSVVVRLGRRAVPRSRVSPPTDRRRKHVCSAGPVPYVRSWKPLVMASTSDDPNAAAALVDLEAPDLDIVREWVVCFLRAVSRRPRFSSSSIFYFFSFYYVNSCIFVIFVYFLLCSRLFHDPSRAPGSACL